MHLAGTWADCLTRGKMDEEKAVIEATAAAAFQEPKCIRPLGSTGNGEDGSFFEPPPFVEFVSVGYLSRQILLFLLAA